MFFYVNKIIMLKSIIKNAKKHYYGKQFDESKGNIKKTWNLINALRGKHKDNISPSFIIDSKLVLDRRAIANGFNSKRLRTTKRN